MASNIIYHLRSYDNKTFMRVEYNPPGGNYTSGVLYDSQFCPHDNIYPIREGLVPRQREIVFVIENESGCVTIRDVKKRAVGANSTAFTIVNRGGWKVLVEQYENGVRKRTFGSGSARIPVIKSNESNELIYIAESNNPETYTLIKLFGPPVTFTEVPFVYSGEKVSRYPNSGFNVDGKCNITQSLTTGIINLANPIVENPSTVFLLTLDDVTTQGIKFGNIRSISNYQLMTNNVAMPVGSLARLRASIPVIGPESCSGMSCPGNQYCEMGKCVNTVCSPTCKDMERCVRDTTNNRNICIPVECTACTGSCYAKTCPSGRECRMIEGNYQCAIIETPEQPGQPKPAEPEEDELTAGQIAGIVIGSVVGGIILITIINLVYKNMTAGKQKVETGYNYDYY